MEARKGRCSHFPSCRGCSFQHLPYDEQLSFKESALRALYAPLLKKDPACLLPALGARSRWRYRNKMEFSFSQDRLGRRFLGLYQKRSRILTLTECLLAPEWFLEALAYCFSFWEESALRAYHPYSNAGTLRTLTLREGRRTQERMAVLTVSGNPDFALREEQIAAFVAALEPLGDRLSLFVRIHQAIKGQPTRFFEIHVKGPASIEERLNIGGRELLFKISPSSFFQPNSEMAELLYNKALDLLSLPPQATLFDLYCGTGTLGIAFASRAARLVGIEENPYALFDAKENCRINKIGHFDLYKGDVGALLSRVAGDAPHAVIIDPPRTGLDAKALKEILSLRPSQILYISCNPQTHAKDLQELSSSYEVAALQPIDQFPHTPHIEAIALLKQIS
ncbi:MAG TPA: 23S rRNA (uracil(1939)-C(5))-methyltransferase RlmD [Parachlamydiales bacterium]|nr:23S rRNA (uracil(1939)-C(5))-methyltransferase RlmD [Parachlamydiales bacterium]